MKDKKLWLMFRIEGLLMVTLPFLYFFIEDYRLVLLLTVIVGVLLVVSDLDYKVYSLLKGE